MFKRFATDLIGMPTSQHAALTTTTGVLGAILTYSFGGWSGVIEFFFILLVADYVSGIAASLYERKGLSSQVGGRGLIKKSMYVLAVFLGYRADIAFGTNYIMNGMLYGFIANELVSITENYGRMELPLSQYLQPLIAVLKNKGGGGNV